MGSMPNACKSANSIHLMLHVHPLLEHLGNGIINGRAGLLEN